VGYYGSVFDVSVARELYQPGGAFNQNAGKDATEAMSKMGTVPRTDVDGTRGLAWEVPHAV
jgi:hypothetical protein